MLATKPDWFHRKTTLPSYPALLFVSQLESVAVSSWALSCPCPCFPCHPSHCPLNCCLSLFAIFLNHSFTSCGVLQTPRAYGGARLSAMPGRIGEQLSRLTHLPELDRPSTQKLRQLLARRYSLAQKLLAGGIAQKDACLLRIVATWAKRRHHIDFRVVKLLHAVQSHPLINHSDAMT